MKAWQSDNLEQWNGGLVRGYPPGAQDLPVQEGLEQTAGGSDQHARQQEARQDFSARIAQLSCPLRHVDTAA